ncbi:MAG: creatininase family protein, partial [Firmicutes bacterium]|nr:creatininase family protein [Bacillota bacterium]
MTSKAFQEQVIGKVRTALLPIGTIEAHGQHCPLYADVAAPVELVRRLENANPDRVIALPAIPFGSSWDLQDWPGTLSVSAETLAAYVGEVVQSMARWGIRNVVLMNGHGGNAASLQLAMNHIADAGMRVVLVNWWADYRSDILNITETTGHAGEDETSVMIALDPSGVKMEDATYNPYQPRFRFKEAAARGKLLHNATTGDSRK